MEAGRCPLKMGISPFCAWVLPIKEKASCPWLFVLPIWRCNVTSFLRLLPQCLPHHDGYPGSVSWNKLFSVLWLALVWVLYHSSRKGGDTTLRSQEPFCFGHHSFLKPYQECLNQWVMFLSSVTRPPGDFRNELVTTLQEATPGALCLSPDYTSKKMTCWGLGMNGLLKHSRPFN